MDFKFSSNAMTTFVHVGNFSDIMIFLKHADIS